LYQCIKNNNIGLVSFEGKIILPCQYDIIYKGNTINCIIGEKNNNREVYQFEPSTTSISAKQPVEFEQYVYANSVTNDGSILLDYKGKLIAKNVSLDGASYIDNFTPFYTTYVTRNDSILGSINYLGEWIIKHNDYSNIQSMGKYPLSYVINRESKTGIINCKGKEIVHPEYEHIAYDRDRNILWYNVLPASNGYYRNDDIMKNIWKVKSINTSKSIQDTLCYPTEFIEGYCLTQNKHNLYGVFDSLLNSILPFQYKSYFTLYIPQPVYILAHKNGYNEVFNSKFNLINSNHYDKIKELNEKLLIACKGNSIYILNHNFEAIDSSMNFYTDRKLLINQDGDESLHNIKKAIFNSVSIFKMKHIYNNDWDYGYYQYESDSAFEAYQFKTNQLNFMTIVYAFNDNYTYMPFSQLEVFPMVPYQNGYYNDYYNRIFDGNLIKTLTNFNITLDNIYKPSRVEFTDFSNYNQCNIVNSFDQIIGLTYVQDVNYRDHFYTNIYMTENGILNYLYLDDLIPIENTTVFNRIVIDKLTEIDPDIVPCYENPNFYEMLTEKMVLGESFARFYLNNEVEFDIPYSKLKPLMRPYWIKQLGF